MTGKRIKFLIFIFFYFSFLPILMEKQNSQPRPIQQSRKSTTLTSSSLPQRHILPKSFLTTNTKPKLEPILEHITPRQYLNRKLIIKNTQIFK